MLKLKKYLNVKIVNTKVLNGVMASDPVDEILVQWQRERPDLDAAPMGIVGRLARLAKHWERSVQATFSDYALRPGEFDVLATLRRSGAPYQLSPTALFNSMMVSSGTMTHRLDRLEQAGLVKRGPDPSDRRGTIIHLTDEGFERVERAVESHIETMNRLLNALEPSEHEALASLLRKLLISLE